jgi:hypothetical protein
LIWQGPDDAAIAAGAEVRRSAKVLMIAALIRL